ncbi:hypothetical protein [Nesterenkonia flava]|uniref:Sensor domain-containing protein n=1 Tax=Nesterenkonia flava TaxID=469799 RepID=A0ABU1FRS7_9MICC|nr:hypothetical protein [Nesterenkonia flava]MDR5711373.1 hypothetical protein [Nesterenkonia flava]
MGLLALAGVVVTLLLTTDLLDRGPTGSEATLTSEELETVLVDAEDFPVEGSVVGSLALDPWPLNLWADADLDEAEAEFRQMQQELAEELDRYDAGSSSTFDAAELSEPCMTFLRDVANDDEMAANFSRLPSTIGGKAVVSSPSSSPSFMVVGIASYEDASPAFAGLWQEASSSCGEDVMEALMESEPDSEFDPEDLEFFEYRDFVGVTLSGDIPQWSGWGTRDRTISLAIMEHGNNSVYVYQEGYGREELEELIDAQLAAF